METLKPTQEQVDITRAVLTENSLIIKAFSGAAKTTTLQIIANTYRKKRILYLAYNSSIQEEARIKFNGMAEVRTIHSFGLSYVKGRMQNIDIRQQSYKAIEVKELLGIDYEDAKRVLESFASFCSSDLSISDFAINFKSQLSDKVIVLYKKILKGEYYCTHDVYLKMFQLLLMTNEMQIEFDILMIDEAQDLNDVKISIVNIIKTKRKILVGDSHQQIYNFTGSVDAIDKIKGTTLYLTETFRFGKDIASKANSILLRFKDEKNQIKTNVDNTNKEILTRAFISRTNMALIAELVLLYKNKRSDFKTIRNPETLFCLTEELYYYINNQKEKIKVNRYLLDFKNIMELEKHIDNGDDRELSRAREIILEYKDEILDIKRYAVQQYQKKSGVNYFLMTAHASKGLEFDEVILASDFPLAPELIAKAGYSCHEDFMLNLKSVDRKYLEEFNLLYVAITRAKISLIESDCEAMKYVDCNMELLNSKTREAFMYLSSMKKGGQ